jgi:hypothetical protein
MSYEIIESVRYFVHGDSFETRYGAELHALKLAYFDRFDSIGVLGWLDTPEELIKLVQQFIDDKRDLHPHTRRSLGR